MQNGAYTIRRVNARLISIRWKDNPNHQQAMQFITDLRHCYEQADGPVYTIADLSQGHINDMGVIARMSSLSQHPNHGGGVTYGGDYRADMYVNLYERMAHPTNGRNWYMTLKEALDELERRVPGIMTHAEREALFRPGEDGTANIG